MSFISCYESNKIILMEGGLGERLKREYNLSKDGMVAQNKVDFLYAGIMPALPEAIGMAMAMEQTKLPYMISFMIKSDGKLIDGTSIHEAISQIDKRVKQKPVCYMTNCVHPTNLYKALENKKNQTSTVRDRFHGIQANISALSPEELDHCKDLKCSDSALLAKQIFQLKERMDIKIIGGCCGTNRSHIEEMAKLF